MQDIAIPFQVGKYTFVRVIGRGAFAVIALFIDEKTQQNVAIKFLDRQKFVDEGLMKYMDVELRLVTRFNHPSFAKVYDVIFDEKYVMIVMEYLPNGNVIEYFQNNGYMSFQNRVGVCYKVLQGLVYLHQRGVSHRDIKPENIVFDQDNEPKIIDFGLSSEKVENNSTLCGTSVYMAPEVIMNQNYNGLKADIWSFGVTANIILTHELPFEYVSEAKFIRDVKTGKLEVRNYCGGMLAKMLASCLEQEPEKRPSATELMEMMEKVIIEMNLSFPNQSKKNVVPKLTIPGNNSPNKVTTVRKHLPIGGRMAAIFRLKRVSSF